MLYKKHVLIASLFFVFFNCKNESSTTFSNVTITTKTNKLVEVDIPKAIGTNSIVSNINDAINKLVIATLQFDTPDTVTSKSIEESINLFNDEYNAFIKDFPNSPQHWEAEIDGEVMFQSPEVISISITSYTNTGGAHGNTNITFLNFDATTGKRITNSDLIKNKDAFETVVKSHFKDAITEEDILFEPNKFQMPANIGFNDEGVILLYNTYEIAPYSTGIIDFTIPIEKVRSFLVLNSSY